MAKKTITPVVQKINVSTKDTFKPCFCLLDAKFPRARLIHGHCAVCETPTLHPSIFCGHACWEKAHTVFDSPTLNVFETMVIDAGYICETCEKPVTATQKVFLADETLPNGCKSSSVYDSLECVAAKYKEVFNV